MLRRRNLKRVLLPPRGILPRKRRQQEMFLRLMLLPRKRKELRMVNQKRKPPMTPRKMVKNLKMKRMIPKTKPRTRMTIL